MKLRTPHHLWQVKVVLKSIFLFHCGKLWGGTLLFLEFRLSNKALQSKYYVQESKYMEMSDNAFCVYETARACLSACLRMWVCFPLRRRAGQTHGLPPLCNQCSELPAMPNMLSNSSWPATLVVCLKHTHTSYCKLSRVVDLILNG